MSEKENAKNEAEQPKRECPVVDLIAAYMHDVLKALGQPYHDAIERGRLSFTAEQDGFLRNMNRQDYRRDAEAFASAKVELTETGKVLNYSTMKTRRLHDVVRITALEIATEIFPATDRKDGKKNSRKKEREQLIAQIGFEEYHADEWKGKSTRFRLVKPEATKLLEDLALLIPERFEGSAAPTKPNKVTVGMLTPAALKARRVNINLYDPTVVTVDDYGEDFAWVSMVLEQGWAFADIKADVPQTYLVLIEAAKAAKEDLHEAVA